MARHVVVALTVAAAFAFVTSVAAGAGGVEAQGRSVAFVPLGDFPRSDAETLARSLQRKLGIPMRVRSSAAIPPSTFNAQRRQYVAEELIDVVAPLRAAGSNEVLIGLTTRDMHTRDIPNWRFSFSIRHPSGLAVVSRARMDPSFFGLPADRPLRMRRLRKMVLKNVGLLALGLSQSRDPRSAVYDVILSTDDLDFMTEDFRPRATQAERRWLGSADASCERSIAEAKALIARSPVVTPEQLLAFARSTLEIAERLRKRLAAISRPSEDRAEIAAWMAAFARAIASDRDFASRLSKDWDEATLRRWAEAGTGQRLALKSRGLELGSRGCARYFEPSTYVR